MLSGFILAHVYGPAFAAGTFSYRRFLIARLARLYPLHLAVLASVLVMVPGRHRWCWSRLLAAAAALITTLLLIGALQLALDDRIVVALAAPVILTWSLLARANCEPPDQWPPAAAAGSRTITSSICTPPRSTTRFW